MGLPPAGLRNIFKQDVDSIKKFTTFGAKIPYLYSTVKVHKPDNPVRPIVSTVCSVARKLEGCLAKVLVPMVGGISSSHIRNNVDFVEQMNNFKPTEDFKMCSFDVTSLYTNVPIEVVLDYLRDHLENIDLPYDAHIILKLLELCVKDACFQFQDCFYLQLRGMQMGCRLSPVFAQIYMEIYERNLAGDVIQRCLFWRRYMDDVFSVWRIQENLEWVLERLNAFVDSIQFTREDEADESLAFLDVCVIRMGRNFQYKIYRKACNNLLIVNSRSEHEAKIKKMALRCFYLRALRIVSPRFMEEEEEKIMEIALRNGFDQDFALECKKMAEKTYYSLSKTIYTPNNILCLDFHPNFVSLGVPLRTLGINLIFKYESNVKQLLIKNSPCDRSGIIYKIPCSCKSFYIGQTSFELAYRVQQHKKYVINNVQMSACNTHYKNCVGDIRWDKAEVIYNIGNYFHRNFLEAACILTTWERNFNLNLGVYKMDNLSLSLINGQFGVKEKFL